MKTPRMAYAVGNLDDDLLAEAESYRPKDTKPVIWKWCAAAASLALIVAIAALLAPQLLGAGGTAERYAYSVSEIGGDVEWPWEYKTLGEKYSVVFYGGAEYFLKSLQPVSLDALGESLGSCKATGTDSYTGTVYTEELQIRAITGVSAQGLIAAGKDEEFYVYAARDAQAPASFGELLELYSLPVTLPFSAFSVYKGGELTGTYTLEDDAFVWEILCAQGDAELLESTGSFVPGEREYLSFTATSEALGVYKRVVYITADGYFATNVFDVSYAYFIGEDATAEILSYVESHCAPAQQTAYTQTISGTLTEISSDYILLDDSILCTDPADGKVYTIAIDGLRMRRCVEAAGIEVGDTVCVSFSGEISDNGEVSGAYEMRKGEVVKKNLQIPE